MDLTGGQLHEGDCSAPVQLGYAGLAGHLLLLLCREAWLLDLEINIFVLLSQIPPQ